MTPSTITRGQAGEMAKLVSYVLPPLATMVMCATFFLSSRRRHTRFDCDWSSDVCSSDLCTSDTLAIAVIAAAGERGLAVPRDLSVVGFDDSLLASLSSPALTSVRVDYTEFGAAATTALLAEIDGATAPEYKPAAPSLELRASTAAAARS